MLGLWFAGANPTWGQDSLKGAVRSWFGALAAATTVADPGPLPDGVVIWQAPGCRGIRLEPGRFRVAPLVWSGSHGLLDEVRRRAASDAALLAAINGTFYSMQGPLGPIVIDGRVPERPRPLPGTLSRCCLVVIEEDGRRRWRLGETAASLATLVGPGWPPGLSVNRPVAPGARVVHLLGGGGWIVRQGRDVHMEAYQRQRFRFRRVDQDSRHTVVAMDDQDRLYLLVFENGANLSRVSAVLRDRAHFPGITEAVFFDGGSSSTLVWRDDYLVAPLYLIDKARFSAIGVWSVAAGATGSPATGSASLPTDPGAGPTAP
ncbi:MAG: hypothetical protein OZSIB_3232 [Candidatus Ozemobacter sibiricus]|uniref:Phosphodiester glycosidase domain-containing protein n=1 Tax=Candidatus Ozemobacter sibiricus TaxID=2268124 RepID=A0A367ZR09_9BACT|nr:MAG: hypothetical protein OZSIB_3232 [Candidatus Ozemobacter sibiricus]